MAYISWLELNPLKSMLPKRQTEELEYPAMKPEQLEVAVPFIEGRDVFAVLPTGFRVS